MKKILVLQGPNLNLLGTREPHCYGTKTLNDIHQQLQDKAAPFELLLSFFQSNSESALIERIHTAAVEKIDYFIVNLAAFSHTSIALRDALLAIAIPFIEVHLTNIYARESFRQQSLLSDIANGVICGFGPLSYSLALEAIIIHSL